MKPERLLKRLEKQRKILREKSKKLSLAYRKVYKRVFQQTPKYKAYQKAYTQSPRGKAYYKAYRQKPKWKAYVTAYQQTPKWKAYQKAYYLKVIKPKRRKERQNDHKRSSQ